MPDDTTNFVLVRRTPSPCDFVSLLFQGVPEFAVSRAGDDNSLEYSVFGDLGLALAGSSATVSLSENAVERAFAVIAKMVESKDEQAVNLVAVGVFEALGTTEAGRHRAKTYVTGEGRRLLDRVLARWAMDPLT